MLGDRMNNGRFNMALLTSLAGSVILTAPALGDVQSVTPYFAVATEKASAHCGSNDRFYRIGDLTPAQVVLVDGEGEGWSRISYPSSLTAFVRVEDVKVENGIAHPDRRQQAQGHQRGLGLRRQLEGPDGLAHARRHHAQGYRTGKGRRNDRRLQDRGARVGAGLCGVTLPASCERCRG